MWQRSRAARVVVTEARRTVKLHDGAYAGRMRGMRGVCGAFPVLYGRVGPISSGWLGLFGATGVLNVNGDVAAGVVDDVREAAHFSFHAL